jgi:two-component system cell cycle response regulator
VLFVDDEAYMRRLMTARLERLGAQVDLAAGAQECLAYLAHTRPDLIISDAVMPVLDGFDLCRRLKQDPLLQSIPFIILTALARDLRQRSLQAGADDYLSKLENEVTFRLRARLAFRLGCRRRDRSAAVPAVTGADLLVVSGARAIQAQVNVHLRWEGVQIRPAQDLPEALRLLQAQVPDLLVLDLAYGQEAIMEWILRLRAAPGCADLAILALAAREDETWLPALEGHIQDRLSKPLDGQEGRHRVNLLLQIIR